MQKSFIILVSLILIGCSSYKETYHDPINKIKIYEKENGKHLVKLVYERDRIQPLVMTYNQILKHLIIGTNFDYSWYEKDEMGVILTPVALILTPSMFKEGLLVDIEIYNQSDIIAYSRDNLIHAPVESFQIEFYVPTYEERGPVNVIETRDRGPFKYIIIVHDKNQSLLGKREILFELDKKEFLDIQAS